ncbi:biotin biosynthesis protein BioC [Kingella potus]|uniref:Biotin biosynthesis protein BioC n=1 Tax=Kingella potus TaxID=265175 RepID=A0A377R1P0_9NEIS|nr:methyltransferase [Kingella potus]STR02421.1 biotin biosynthesis protein BioC [Kingella potus]
MNNDRWQIHRYLAQTADSRLALFKTAPQHILLAGADGDVSRSLLCARYPKAAFSEYDPRAGFLQAAAAERKSGLLARLAGKTVPQHCQSLSAPLPEACADMLWSNLGLATEADPLPVFRAWAHALKTDGLLFFTHFGRDTLAELTGRLNAQGIAARAPALVDMHDLGDMLADSGFYDPVTDTAALRLDYRHADTFWQDADTLGLWRALDFDDPAAARAATDKMWQSGELRHITLETVYGHALKKKHLPAGESEVRFFPRGQAS